MKKLVCNAFVINLQFLTVLDVFIAQVVISLYAQWDSWEACTQTSTKMQSLGYL